MIIILRKKQILYLIILVIVLVISILALLKFIGYKKSIETWTIPRGYVTMTMEGQRDSIKDIYNLSIELNLPNK